jgi:hypothetical protein
MTHQLTLALPDEVYQPLAQRAQETGRTVEAVAEERLAEAVRGQQPGDRLRAFAGFWASNIPDAGLRHDEYLGQALHEELNEPRHD